jgi:hypothetical protein
MAAQVFGGHPELLLIILPQSAAEIRRDVKRFGDITAGCAVQCVVSNLYNLYLIKLITILLCSIS